MKNFEVNAGINIQQILFTIKRKRLGVVKTEIMNKALIISVFLKLRQKNKVDKIIGIKREKGTILK